MVARAFVNAAIRAVLARRGEAPACLLATANFHCQR